MRSPTSERGRHRRQGQKRQNNKGLGAVLTFLIMARRASQRQRPDDENVIPCCLLRLLGHIHRHWQFAPKVATGDKFAGSRKKKPIVTLQQKAESPLYRVLSNYSDVWNTRMLRTTKPTLLWNAARGGCEMEYSKRKKSENTVTLSSISTLQVTTSLPFLNVKLLNTSAQHERLSYSCIYDSTHLLIRAIVHSWWQI